MQQCDVCRREVHRDAWLAHVSGKKHRKQEEKRAKGARPEEEAQAQPKKRPRDDGERLGGRRAGRVIRSVMPSQISWFSRGSMIYSRIYVKAA